MNNKQKKDFINIVFEKLHIYLYIEEAEKWYNAMVSILEEFNKNHKNCNFPQIIIYNMTKNHKNCKE